MIWGGKTLAEHQTQEVLRIVPHARTLRKAREQIKCMVIDGLSAYRIRNYLHRFCNWWALTTTVWHYSDILRWFIETCWERRLADYASRLLRKHLTESHATKASLVLA